jgi:hypothetical protein
MSNDILSPCPETQDSPLVIGRGEQLFRDVQSTTSDLLLLFALFCMVGLISSSAANMLPGRMPFDPLPETVVVVVISCLTFLVLAIIFECANGGSLAGSVRTLVCRSRRLLGILGVRRSPRQALTAILLGLDGGALAVGFQKVLFLTVTFPPSTQTDERFFPRSPTSHRS